MDSGSVATVLRSAGRIPRKASVSSITEVQAGGGGALGKAGRLTRAGITVPRHLVVTDGPTLDLHDLGESGSD